MIEKSIRKRLGIILTASAAILLLGGCSGKKQPETQAPTEAPQQTEAPAPVTEAVEEVTEAAETELYSEPEVVSVPLNPENLAAQLAQLKFRFGDDITLAQCLAQNGDGTAVRSEDDIYRVRTLADYYRMRGYDVKVAPKSQAALCAQLNKLIGTCDGEWSVYTKVLNSSEELLINDAAMPSASLMKLFIMGTVYQAVADGELAMTDEIAARLSGMITYSSNGDSNALLALLGAGSLADGIAKVNAYIDANGYVNSHEYNGFQDENTILDPDHFNQVSAVDVASLLEKVYHRTFASRKICNDVESWMLSQATRYKIPAGIPGGILVGNKSGETSDIENDAAIVYAPGCDYILVVLSNNWTSKDAAQQLIRAISGEVYAYYTSDSYMEGRMHIIPAEA